MNDKNEDFKNKNYLLECEIQELKIKVSELEVKLERLNVQKKHNDRNAGRKQFDDNDTIRRVFRMYAQGKSFQQIADMFNSEGIMTKSGGTWSKSSIRYIFNNESYVEKGVLTKKEYDLNFT